MNDLIYASIRTLVDKITLFRSTQECYLLNSIQWTLSKSAIQRTHCLPHIFIENSSLKIRCNPHHIVTNQQFIEFTTRSKSNRMVTMHNYNRPCASKLNDSIRQLDLSRENQFTSRASIPSESAGLWNCNNSS